MNGDMEGKVMAKYQIDEKIVDEVAILYSETDTPIKEIINAYKLNIPENMLYRLLPPLKTKVKCIYCGEFMETERPSRSSGKIKERLFCSKCNHVTYNNEFWECKCNKCLESKQRILKSSFKCDPVYAKGRLETYGQLLELFWVLDSFGRFDLQDQCWYVELKKEMSEAEQSIFESLLEAKLLYVSGKSDISAFIWNNGEQNSPSTYYTYRVTYRLNDIVHETDKEHLIKSDSEFLKNIQKRISKPNVIKKILKKLFEEELYTFILEEFEKRAITPHISESGRTNMKRTLEKVGFLKSLKAYKYKATNISDSLITGKIKGIMAENMALGCGYSYVQYAEEKGWKIEPLKIEQIEITPLFRFFIDRILKEKGMESLLDLSYNEIDEVLLEDN